MNNARPTSFTFGKLRGNIYDFDNIGDVLAKHTHIRKKLLILLLLLKVK
jgi:hypothetical protein